jgi:hypothetical protein
VGISAKALWHKALARLRGRYKQSYPQKSWTKYKRFVNQALSRFFSDSHQQNSPSGARTPLFHDRIAVFIASPMSTWLCVLVPTPAHSALGPLLTYRSPQPLPVGTLVRVPLGLFC